MRNRQVEIGAVLALESSKLLRATRAGSQPRYRPAEQQHQLSIGSPIETPLPPSADAGKSDPAGIPRRIGAGSDSHRHALTDHRMILSRIYSPASLFGCVRRVGAALRIPARTPAVNLRLALRESRAVFAPHVWYHDRQARYASARLVDVGLHREAQPFGNTSCHADVGHICSPRSLLALRHRQDRRADPGA